MPIRHFLVYLVGTRDGWPDNMSEREEKIMSEHYYYLKDLTTRKKVILACPCLPLRKGIVILQTVNEEEAHLIMNDEPSVKEGVHRYEMYPMTVSLLAENKPPDR
jgi:uncharacterized protein YciI